MKWIFIFTAFFILSACTQVVTYRQAAIIPMAAAPVAIVEPLGVATMVGIRPEDPMTMMVEYY